MIDGKSVFAIDVDAGAHRGIYAHTDKQTRFIKETLFSPWGEIDKIDVTASVRKVCKEGRRAFLSSIVFRRGNLDSQGIFFSGRRRLERDREDEGKERIKKKGKRNESKKAHGVRLN